MLQNQLADRADRMFDKDTAKIVRRHAFWAAFVMFFPLFGLDWIFFVWILWDMYSSLCKRAGTSLSLGSVIVGIVVNLGVAAVIDTLLTAIIFIGWLGTSFIVYLQFYFSGKLYLETIKAAN